MLLEAAPVEPLPIDATATAVLVASLVITALWVAYLYR
ncbi:hypothetical protein C469_15738 [Halorubrum lipolyticum DSM 21995]|uniref:Uncharacterized protein n=1 Tax=Halorubrum lipolyticum DSM 21995 TaxID=1227482 RepID=M0NHZ8_9EURY|nr:hypothetical protein C469_15738 [Halorubrum lipolyticum DSM 21995]